MHRRRRRSSPTSDRGGGVAAVGFVGARRAGRCGCRRDHQRGAARRRAPSSSAPTAERTDAAEVERAAVAVEAQRGVDRGGVGLVGVGRGRSSRTSSASGSDVGAAAQRQPGRLDGHGGGVLVVGGDRAGALAAARADEAA